jgi:predicted DCC family thiol-disulfide oxidoreductase YuxK
MSARLEVYYDGWCPICTGIKERLRRLDRRGRLSFCSMREPGVPERAGVSAEALAARMYVRDLRTGRVAGGITAVRYLAAALPALWPLWPLIWVSEKLGFGGFVYDWIAARRPIVPVGHCSDEGCPIHRPG